MHHTPSHSAIQTAVPWHGAHRLSCDHVIALVSRHKNVPIHVIMHATRQGFAAARARQLAMYLAHVVYGCNLTEIGEAFGRDRTTVSYACSLIEDMRDDPHFDAEVCSLEQQLQDSAAIAGAGHGA